MWAEKVKVIVVPTGKVKWYDPAKGFGFLTQEDGEDVYLPESALPVGTSTIKPGQKVEFGMAVGRRGPQALTVTIIGPAPSIVASTKAAAQAKRRPAEQLHGMIDDMIKVLEAQIQPGLRHGKYPDNKSGSRIAGVLRAVAEELDPTV